MTTPGFRHTQASRKRMSEAKRGTKATSAHCEAIASGIRSWWEARRAKENALKREQTSKTLPASVLATAAGRVSEVQEDVSSSQYAREA